ncbi:MAG: GntR family transcriptional regulator [Actinomycetota bacterium]
MTQENQASQSTASSSDNLDRDIASSRAAWVYEVLRTRITEGRIRPNARLVETAVAEELDISRTPVREALHRLATAGYVMGGRSGWSVREHTAREIQEIFETRAALEGYASRLTAVRASTEELDAIAQTRGAEGERLLRISREELVDINDLFHNAIYAGSGNERLIDLIRRNRDFYFNYRIADLYSQEELHTSVVEHEAIIGALWDRDGRRAEILMRRHILRSVPIVISRLRPPSGSDLPKVVMDPPITTYSPPGEEIS